MLTLSLIIPVYNEQRHIKACLDSIALQTSMPDEVIVVDNNCSDDTIAIAQQYEFVSVIKEPKQGLIHARNKGFNVATGAILGRIDADSQIATDWVARVKVQLAINKSLDGVTGLGYTHSIPYLSRPRTLAFSKGYYRYIKVSIGLQVLWGATMAIRASTWQDIKEHLCLDDSIVHEDQDISIVMHSLDKKIALDATLRIFTPGYTYRYLPKTLFYARLHRSTVSYHNQKLSFNNSLNQKEPLLYRSALAIGLLPLASYMWIASILPFPMDYYLQRRSKKQSRIKKSLAIRAHIDR